MNDKKTSLLAFIIGAPIGCLGGLIGLGGAEFRLPFLLKTFSKGCKKRCSFKLGIDVKLAVTMRLIISLPTMLVGITDIPKIKCILKN